MYLKKLILENVGPLKNLSIVPSFDNDMPKPLVLVGANGSGKSIALSFVANFLLYMQQCAFENTEVTKGKVFKLRSPQYIGPNMRHYYARVEFDQGLGLEEWQLQNTKKSLVDSGFKTEWPSWTQLGDNDSSAFFPMGEAQNPESQVVKDSWNKNCALYFPPNRFEDPAWLNADNLQFKPEVSLTKNIIGITRRQLISTSVFKSLVPWVYDLVIDSMMFENAVIPVTFQETGEVKQCLMPVDGRNRKLKAELDRVVDMIFSKKYGEKVSIQVLPKHVRNVALVKKLEDGNYQSLVTNLFSLSSGESLVFSLFASIVRDFDLCLSDINSIADIRGVVLVDEIDAHLHMDLQRTVLPQLIKAFPKVQFILTTHSPLFLLGMDEYFGADGYDIYALPTNEKINTQEFFEFQDAYDAYTSTMHHRGKVNDMLYLLSKPCLITEGKTDRKILETAWRKLYADTPCIVDIKSSGEIRGTDGSAKHLQSMLQYGALLAKYPILALFDNDAEGNAQFGGLKGPLFVEKAKGIKEGGMATAILLPAPETRQKFVNPERGAYCHLQIEHYFSDTILEGQNKKGVEIVAGSGVYDIQGDKNAFADYVDSLEIGEFDNFHMLYCQIAEVLGAPHPVKKA